MVGGGIQKSNIFFGVPHGDMLQFLPPRVPPPQNISVAVRGGGGLGKCNIAGVPPSNAQVTLFTSPQGGV
jgi:hypothetical protein